MATGSRCWSRQESPIDKPLHTVRVTRAQHLDAGGSGVDLLKVLDGELQVGGAEVLFEPCERSGAGDRNNPRLPGKLSGRQTRPHPRADMQDPIPPSVQRVLDSMTGTAGDQFRFGTASLE